VEVSATGRRAFYTPETAARYGLANRADRCLECPEGERCRFYLDLRAYDGLRTRYLECEQYDGYQRDHCVFAPENGTAFDPKVDIEDTMSVRVAYAGGPLLTYSLVSFCPWEGYGRAAAWTTS
jgi:hypothetical protein